MCIKEMDDLSLRSADMPFSVPSSAGQEVQLSSKYCRITPENKAEYIRLAMEYRWVCALSTELFPLTTGMHALSAHQIVATKKCLS